YQERRPIQQKSLELRDERVAQVEKTAVPKPQWLGDAKMIFKKLSPEEQAEFNAWKNYDEERAAAVFSFTNILEPDKQRWQQENAQYYFQSIPEGDLRRFYDDCRRPF